MGLACVNATSVQVTETGIFQESLFGACVLPRQAVLAVVVT